MKKTVIYLGGPEGAEATAEVLSDIARVEILPNDQEAVRQIMLTADAVLDASMKVALSNDMIADAVNLKVISCATTGSDHIQRETIKDRNIPVHTLREDGPFLKNITPAAELTWSLVLACARKLPTALSHVRQGQWDRDLFPGMMLNGRQLGAIGCGRIGGWVSRYAQAFGMKTVGYDPVLSTLPDGIESVSMEDLFATSDVISIHVHLSEETTGMVTRDLLMAAKPGAIFVNTSRGALVDEAALLEALEAGRIGAAGLDVLNGEPDIADHPLLRYAQNHENLLITPHCGGFSPDAVQRVCRRAAEKIIPYLK